MENKLLYSYVCSGYGGTAHREKNHQLEKEVLKKRIKLLNLNLKKKSETKKRKSSELAEGIVNYEVGILSKPNRKNIQSERFNQLVELLSLRVDAQRQHVFPEQALRRKPLPRRRAATEPPSW